MIFLIICISIYRFMSMGLDFTYISSFKIILNDSSLYNLLSYT